MDKFVWGKVIDQFSYDFDGKVLEVTKYHPKNYPTSILYHCEEMHSSHHELDALVISWIAHKRLGLNQHNLVSGLCRALEIKE